MDNTSKEYLKIWTIQRWDIKKQGKFSKITSKHLTTNSRLTKKLVFERSLILPHF